MPKDAVKLLGMALLAGFVISIGAGSCTKKGDNPQNAVPPVFSVTPVDMSGPYNPSDSTYGDIKFISPVIIPFGALVTKSALSPAIEYYTRLGAPVRAVTDGIVDTVIANPPEEGDYEIHVICIPGADYTVIYDHLLVVNVLNKEMVSPGDTLGEAGTWSTVMRRTTLGVKTGQGSDTRVYCPLDFGDAAFKLQHHNLLLEYNSHGFIPVLDTLCLSGSFTP